MKREILQIKENLKQEWAELLHPAEYSLPELQSYTQQEFKDEDSQYE